MRINAISAIHLANGTNNPITTKQQEKQPEAQPAFKSGISHMKGYLSGEEKSFLDKYDDAMLKGKRSPDIGNYEWIEDHKGLSGKVDIYQNQNTGEGFAVKTSKPLKYLRREDTDQGGLSYEYDMMKEASIISNEIQQPKAYVKANSGKGYLLSEFMSGDPIGKSTHGANEASGGDINSSYCKNLIGLLEKLDNNGIFSSDLNRGNIFKDGYSTPGLLDFQWAEHFNKNWHPSYIDSFAFYNKERLTNLSSFECNGLADYMLGKDSTYDLSVYLKERAESAQKAYYDTGNNLEKLRAEVYQNPSAAVLDAELLRMAMHRHHKMQFYYTDRHIEKERNVLNMLKHQALASYSARELADYEPAGYTTQREKDFLYEMKQYGLQMCNAFERYYTGSLEWLINLVSGRAVAPGRYFKEELRVPSEEQHTHMKLLNKGSYSWKNYAKNDLYGKVRKLASDLKDVAESGGSISTYAARDLARKHILR